jgi:hypothetical protein
MPTTRKPEPRNQPAKPMTKDRRPRPDMERRAQGRADFIYPNARLLKRNPELTHDAQDNANHEQWEEEQNPVGSMQYSQPPRPDEKDDTETN